MRRMTLMAAMAMLAASAMPVPCARAQRNLPSVHRGLSAQHAFHASGGYTQHWNVHRPGYGLNRCTIPASVPGTYASSYYYRHNYGHHFVGRNLCYPPALGYSYYRYSYAYRYPSVCYYPPACSYPLPTCFFPIVYPTGSCFFFSASTVISPILALRLQGNAGAVAARNDRLVAFNNGLPAAAGRADAEGMLDFLKAHERIEVARDSDRAEREGAALARALRTGDPEQTNRVVPDADWLTMGERAFQGGRYDEAVRFFQRVAEKSPGNVSAWLNLGFAEIARRNWDYALAAFRAAAQQVPSFQPNDCDLNRLYGGNQSTKLAHLDRLAQATLADSKSPDRWLLVGAFLWFDGQHDRAERFLAKAQGLAQPEETLLLAQVLQR